MACVQNGSMRDGSSKKIGLFWLLFLCRAVFTSVPSSFLYLFFCPYPGCLLLPSLLLQREGLSYLHCSRWGTRAVGCPVCLLYTSPSPRDGLLSRMPSSA